MSEEILLPDPNEVYRLFESGRAQEMSNMAREIVMHINRLRPFIFSLNLYRKTNEGDIAYWIMEFNKTNEKARTFIYEMPATAFHYGNDTMVSMQKNIAYNFFHDASINIDNYQFVLKEVIERDVKKKECIHLTSRLPIKSSHS